MIANPNKFQVLISAKHISDNSSIELQINNTNIKPSKEVKLLGVNIDQKLIFESHITNLCNSAARQLNALIRLKSALGFKEKKVLIESFIYSNFDYCPLAWHFSSAKSLQKIENMQKRALQFLFSTYEMNYEELIEKAGKSTMNIRRLRFLCTEIYKTLHDLNPSFMKDIFKLNTSTRSKRTKNILNLSVPQVNQTSYGTKSLRALGPKIWNNLPPHIKSSENLQIFKSLIKKWNGVTCNCNVVSLTEINFFK